MQFSAPFILASLFIVGTVSAMSRRDILVTEQFAAHVNTKAGANRTWTASHDQGVFFKGATKDQVSRLCGVRTVNTAPVLPKMTYPTINRADLPTDFDSAAAWPHCATVRMIRDQSACGSCWAFGAAEAISDRYCTFSTTPKNLTVSANDILSCCGLFQGCGMGCNGGNPSGAWAYWTSTGLVDTACDPYPYPRCEHHTQGGRYPPCPSSDYPTPQCTKTCKNGASWSSSLNVGSRSWTLSGESELMQEIYAHGPVEVAFTVYEDFVTYKSGVYQHVTGSALGGHAVRMVGWGVLNGVPYWKIANSWNEDWGMGGYFLIKRGDNECGIEDQGVAGQP